MRKLLILLILFISSLAWAGSTTVVVGQPTIIGTGNVENYTGSTADGYIYSQGMTFSQCRTGNYLGATTNTFLDVVSDYNVTFPSTYFMCRSWVAIDTSGLPDDSTPVKASLFCYRHASYTSTANVQLFEGTQGASLTYADWAAFGATAWSASTNVAGAGGSWVEIPLNSTGIGAISKTGTTYICIREYDHDVANSAPGSAQYLFAANGQDAGSNVPYLRVWW